LDGKVRPFFDVWNFGQVEIRFEAPIMPRIPGIQCGPVIVGHHQDGFNHGEETDRENGGTQGAQQV